MNRIMTAISVFALFALTIIGMSCASSTQAIKANTASTPAPEAETAQHDHAAEDGVPRISAADAIALVKSGKALVVDTRDKSSFEAIHISGAISVPYQEFVDKTYKALPKDKELIFYCT